MSRDVNANGPEFGRSYVNGPKSWRYVDVDEVGSGRCKGGRAYAFGGRGKNPLVRLT